jgi:hypothetical protein
MGPRALLRSSARALLLGSLAVTACSLLNSVDDLKGNDWTFPDAGNDSGADSSADTGVDASSDATSDVTDATDCDADLSTDPQNCGSCGHACNAGDVCSSGSCEPCDSSTTDCDGDGWLLSEGDCCDKPGACGSDPAMINPGALELVGNGIDDNCNGQTDLFDTKDAVSCDASLYQNSTIGANYARAMGICRTTLEDPPDKKDRTWGLISAHLLRADGSPLGDTKARSIRQSFGSVSPKVTEGSSMVVLSTGIAADGTQTNPGPNGGAPSGTNVSNAHDPPSLVDVTTCSDPLCIADWLAADNPPLKAKNELPTTPDCAPTGTVAANEAHDSVMLVLRVRAPTNVKAFSFNTYFLSAEYPEYVCSNYNDQFIALVDTPTGTPSPVPNPPDKNLLTYSDGTKKWPVGINVAHGTSLFSVCETEQSNSTCWDSDVDSKSCSLGALQLAGTGFEKGGSGSCIIGGGTHWLTAGGNVIPGQELVLRIALWDVGDAMFDSTALVDGFTWLADPIQPGLN